MRPGARVRRCAAGHDPGPARLSGKRGPEPGPGERTPEQSEAAGSSTPGPESGRIDPRQLVDLLEEHLLGSVPTMTGPEVAERAGVDFDTAKERWRSLGFTTVPDDEVAFTEADLKALALTERMHELGLMDEDTEDSLVRTLGRSFARLAEWQLSVFGRSVDLDETDLPEVTRLLSETMPLLEEIQDYVWRRHTVGAATRMLLAPSGEDDEDTPLAVGFADIVGYTRQTRSMHTQELARLVEDFEAEAQRIITDHGGRIIKTIGDEVLFVADDPASAAEIGLRLIEGHLHQDDFPELRVGLAYGPVLARLGDVYGPVVNLAARLTSTARPGRILVDRELAEALKDRDEFRLRRTRRTSVKGYRRLEPWSLRRPMGENPEFARDNLPGPASQFLAERGRDLLRTVDEGQPPTEGTTAPEDVE